MRLAPDVMQCPRTADDTAGGG